MIYVEQREFHSINANSSVNYDYTIPDGEILRLEEMGASSVSGTNTICQIIWDPSGDNEILLAEYGTSIQRTGRQLEGNGSKVLRIRLTNNNLAAPEIMGAYYFGMQGE